MLTELVSEDAAEHNGGFVFLPDGADEAKRLERLRLAGPHPLYGEAAEISDRLEDWPEHWLEASRIDLRSREPLGATHTIDELVTAAAAGPVTGRIAGTVTRLVGIGRDAVVLVDDGTRPVDIWCPAGTSPWGPVHRGRFEFEVTLEGPVPAPLDLEGGIRRISMHTRRGSRSRTTRRPRRSPAKPRAAPALRGRDRHPPAGLSRPQADPRVRFRARRSLKQPASRAGRGCGQRRASLAA